MKQLILSIALLIFCAGFVSAQEQIENMKFDHWYKKGGQWFAASGPTERVWGTANKGLSLLGMNGTTPDEEFVAVPGPGKKAAKLTSRNVLWAFAAGALYTGSWGRLIGTKGAEIHWGIPFHSRPVALKGYYCYKPVVINYARKPFLHRKGQMDRGNIQVFLGDWDTPVRINTVTETFLSDDDPHIIGHGRARFTKDTGGYVRLHLDINYRDERTPKYVIIVATPSDCGNYFTGGDGSTLWLDELKFAY